MSIESALYDHLTSDTALAALLDTRVYPDTAPQGVTAPYVTFHVVTGEHDRHHGGGGGLVRVGMQIDVWAATSLSRRAVADALFNRLHGYRGSMGDEALAVRQVQFDGPTMSYERPTAADEAGIYRARCEAAIWHTEAVPTF